MGASSSKNKKPRQGSKITELIDLNYNDQYAQEEYVQTSECCGLSFSKIRKRKIIWQNNFITNCNIIKEQFKWAGELIDLITSNIQPKTVYFKEINDLKLQMNYTLDTQRQILISPSEVQQFKNNLKRQTKYYQESNSRMASSMSINGKQNKIQISRFRQNNYRSGSNKLERSPSISSSKSGLRKSIMSFVDDTLSSVFGNQRQISKQASQNLQIFLKFSMIVQKHFNDPKCMLCLIKKRFIDYIVRNFSDYSNAKQKISDLIDSINQLSKILKQTIIDYYNLNSFAEGQIAHNPFIANQENLLSLCTTMLFKEKLFYEVVYNCALKFNEERQSKFNKIVQLLQTEPPRTFYIKQKFCLDQTTIKNHMQSTKKSVSQLDSTTFVATEQPYYQCKMILNQLQTSKTPIGKMKTIFTCSEMMNKEVQKFYDVNGLQKEKWVLDADQVLSIFCYIIVGAKVRHLHTHMFILDNFSTSSQMISIFGYYLSVMNCAVQQLQNDYLDRIQALQNQL